MEEAPEKEEIVGKKDSRHNIFLYIMLAGCLIAIAVSFYFFYFKKDYDFYIETKCDPQTENCFFRDCENNPDICPPNGFSYYNQYIIKARDFKSCSNEDCTEACATNLIKCNKVECLPDEADNNGDVCQAQN